jgi:hypothetical protein
VGTHAEREELDVRVLVVQAALERAGGVLGGERLGPDLVAYLQVERDVLCACGEKLRRRLVCGERELPMLLPLLHLHTPMASSAVEVDDQSHLAMVSR